MDKTQPSLLICYQVISVTWVAIFCEPDYEVNFDDTDHRLIP